MHDDAASPGRRRGPRDKHLQRLGVTLHSPQGYDFLVEVLCLPLRDGEGRVTLFANTMERVQDRRFFDAMAATGARMVNFVEHRFIDIGAGLPIFARRP
jgi:hypothetical protein